jgi:hypothetical protein
MARPLLKSRQSGGSCGREAAGYCRGVARERSRERSRAGPSTTAFAGRGRDARRRSARRWRGMAWADDAGTPKLVRLTWLSSLSVPRRLRDGRKR